MNEFSNRDLIDDDRNDDSPLRVRAAFDALYDRLPEEATLPVCPMEAQYDVVLEKGECLKGVTSCGVQAVLIGTDTQPYLVLRNGVVERPESYDDDHPDGNVPYDDYVGVINDHVPPHLQVPFDPIEGEDELEIEYDHDLDVDELEDDDREEEEELDEEPEFPEDEEDDNDY